MKIAVPTWQGRVSPVFDTARHVRCFDVADGTGRPAGEVELPPEPDAARLSKLQENEVSVLLCGAISQPVAAKLSAAGIRLVPFLAGDVEEIVQAFATGRLEAECFRMPGCCGRARRHRGGRCEKRMECRP